MDKPIIKLRPGKVGRLGRGGAPWAFTDQIAMDRRTRSLSPGTIVVLTDGEQGLGTAAFNPESRIAARLLDADPEAQIDGAWLYPEPFYRLVHAEGDGLPGVVIDRFGDTLVVQPNAAWADVLLPELVAAAREVTGCSSVVVNASSRVRALEGLEAHLTVAEGQVDGPIQVPMNGATYLADLTGGQKTGLYYDQRPNHAFASTLSAGASVLDVFSHVGGFGLAALAGGAERVIAIDSSAPALALAEEGAALMGMGSKYTTQKSDAFDALAGLAGEQFDMVICDPPAFAPSKKALDGGLRAYERIARLAAPLVAPGGVLCLCSCSHAAGAEAFHKASITGIGKAGRGGALIWSGRAGPDHPVHIALPETGYLKAFFFRLDG